MKKTVAIKALSNYNYNFIGQLKRSILLFDQIGIPRLESIITVNTKNHSPDCVHNQIANELHYLKSEGLIFDSWNTSNVITMKEGSDIRSIGREFHEITQSIAKNPNSPIIHDMAVRLCCLIINTDKEKENLEAIPLLDSMSFSNGVTTKKADVVSLIIEKLPIPSDTTPWERIIEFKENPDNKGKLAGLKTWVNKSMYSSFNATEIADELDHLLYEYSKSMDIHNIKYNTGLFEAIIILPTEILEKIVTLKFSDAAKKMFVLKNQKLALLEQELSSPGKEIAYIYKANKELF